MKRFLILLSTGTMLASTAIAGNINPPAMAPTPPVAAATGADWSGFYAGGLVSFDSGTREYANPPGSPPSLSYEYEPNTAFGGFAGYNAQRGSMVFGGEAAYSTAGSYVDGFDSAHSFIADLKGRVGFAVGQALIYGTVGYSFTEWSTSGSYAASGLSYGAGLDYLLGEHLFVGAEYLVRDMSATRSNDADQEGIAQINSAQLRVGWKF